MINWRKPVYLGYATLRGYRFPKLLKQYLAEYESGPSGDVTDAALSRLLEHCRQRVPYYGELLKELNLKLNPRDTLRRLPVLTKQVIRSNFDSLQSRDNSRRNCQFNTSGGSTGEPLQLVQDDEFRDMSAALRWLNQHQLGCEVGAPHVYLWGSERDLESGVGSRKSRFFNWLTNSSWMNAFRMSPAAMRGFVDSLSERPPCLIIAYAQAMYELAQFVEQEQLRVAPQRAVLSSAGTLYGFMREKISRVFGCEVYNLYGSREVSDIAWELPGSTGLWAPPWANFMEIVDETGAPVADGTEGNILITCLTNYAMPLVRYSIGDRGALLPRNESPGGVQILSHVAGRNVDVFRRRDRTLVDGEYFTHLLYFRNWVKKFQVVQKTTEHMVFKVVSRNGRPPERELDEIADRCRLAMGADCTVEFDFVEELTALPSGKFRYTISEV